MSARILKSIKGVPHRESGLEPPTNMAGKEQLALKAPRKHDELWIF